MSCRPGHAEHREDPHLAHFLVEPGDDVFFGQRALFEELFHQVVFAFGDQFDQFLVRLFRGFGVLGRDLGFARLCRRRPDV